MVIQNWYREERIIRDLIRDFEASTARAEMIAGEAYYRNENAILSRRQYYWTDQHERVVDETKPNNKVSHAFMKLLVDEKIGYFLGSPPNIAAEDNTFQALLVEIMDDSFDDVLNDVGVEVSNKGLAWLYAYIEPVAKGIGAMAFEPIPSEQVVPIWADRAHRKLSGLINYYYMQEYDITSGSQKDVMKVECWHPDGVMFYTEYNSMLVEDIEKMFPGMEPREIPETGLGHFSVNGKEMTWGEVPFIPFRNNSQELNDLRFVRSIIDGYDKGVSDLANLLEELRRIIVVLKNYQGTSLKEFMDNLRYFGAVKVDEDGGVTKLDLSADITASNNYLDRLKKDFYQFGQGVDMDTDKFGASPSGVALQFLYSGLKLKADNLERKFKSAYKQLFRLVAVYLESIGKGKFDPATASVTFNRSVVSNILDQIKAVTDSMTIISEKTALAHHPWVDDVGGELAEKEKEDKISLDKIPLAADPGQNGAGDAGTATGTV